MAQAGLFVIASLSVSRDGVAGPQDLRPRHWRCLSVRAATLTVDHLARGLYVTVTTRIHFDWTTSFLSDTPYYAWSFDVSMSKAPNEPMPAGEDLDHDSASARPRLPGYRCAGQARANVGPARTHASLPSLPIRWVLGFFLCGSLFGMMGALMVAWRYYLGQDSRLIGLHFLALDAGMLVAHLYARRHVGESSVRWAMISGSLISAVGLVGLVVRPASGSHGVSPGRTGGNRGGRGRDFFGAVLSGPAFPAIKRSGDRQLQRRAVRSRRSLCDAA